MNKLQEGRLKKLLKKWAIDCEYRLARGYKLRIENEIDYAKKYKVESEMNTIKKQYVIGLSNENLPEIKKYRELEKSDFNKKVYYLVSNDDRYFEIPKMIHEYYSNNVSK